VKHDGQKRGPSSLLNWTGYIYGGLAHSSHIEYDEESESRGEASVRRGLKRMGLEPADVAGRRVMDVGTGLYGLGFRRLGAVVEHRDISIRTVNALNAYAKDRRYTNLTSTPTDICAGELPEDHFDLVYLSGIYMVFEEPSRALFYLSRALKEGGYLYIDVYRSGMWRWFVVDVLRRIAGESLLYDVLSRFTEFCALAEPRSFHLRQVEMLIDDLFVQNLHLLHPSDLKADGEELGMESIKAATTMDLLDPGDSVDHSLFFAHVFSTLVFRKTGRAGVSEAPERTRRGLSQLDLLDGMAGSYRHVRDMTAEFLLAHQSGRFGREETTSHIVNLFRMAHPCLPGDPYLIPGTQEPPGSVAAAGDAGTLTARHSRWCSFLANVLGVENPLGEVELESFGYELVRFLSRRAFEDRKGSSAET